MIQEILGHMGEPNLPPRLMPALGPPLWEMAGVEPDESDPQAQPAPDYAAQQIPLREEFDQRIAWAGIRRIDVAFRELLVPEAACAANFRRRWPRAQANGHDGAGVSGAIKSIRREIHD